MSESSSVWQTKELLKSKYLQDRCLNKGFKLGFYALKNCRIICFTVSSPQGEQQVRPYRPKITSFEPDFQFEIQATLTSFKYTGCSNRQESYISQFSQLTFAETLKKGVTMTNYAEGIKTLRMKGNVIRVIEENEEEDTEGVKRSDSQTSSTLELIPQKDEEEIFESRKAFTEFISSYSYGYFLIFVMFFGKVILVGLYVFTYLTMVSHNEELEQRTSEIIYNNLVAGELAKQVSLLDSIDQMQLGQSYLSIPSFLQSYQENIKSLESIKDLGGTPFTVTVMIGSSPVQFQNTDFSLSFLDNANVIYRSISGSVNQSQLLSSMQTSQNTAKNYL